MSALRMPRARGWILRVLGVALLAALLVSVLMSIGTPSASADQHDDEADDWSLYALGSRAALYFGEQTIPGGDGMHDNWTPVLEDPTSAGSMLSYADPDSGAFDAVGWLFNAVSGSSQTISYDTFDDYSGMVDYAHFGAANRDLGLDTMSSGVGGEIVSWIGGGMIWLLFLVATIVGTVFWVIIQLLKLVNPFLWFYQAIVGVTGADPAHQAAMADGMTGGDTGGGALAGLQSWIAGWYGLLQDIAWQALVPLFIGFLLIGMVLFKRMDRGSAIRKLIVRVVFIGVGLPLIGSMYTSVLEKFDDSVLGQHAGPTRVVLSTYVDFEAWMMQDRLAVPGQAVISWDDGQAGSDAMMAVRTTALAINVQANDAFSGIDIGTAADNAEAAWASGMVGMGDDIDETCTPSGPGGLDEVCEVSSNDIDAVFATFGLLNRYIGSHTVAASDFESGIKSSITAQGQDVEAWFVAEGTYGDVREFGEQGEPLPVQHPMFSVAEGEGLTSSEPGGDQTTFTTEGNASDCRFTVLDGEGNLPACNLSPLAAYNYLNTSFGPDSLTMFSSTNATSGFTRESHMAVSQVGTGPAKLMYWANAAVVLGCIAALGIAYALGMLFGAVRRTFGIVAAVPFATLGAMQGIAKVIVYSAALILEVIVTLFLYQFVSEFLISIPDIIAGPLSSFLAPDGLLGSPVLGAIAAVALTLVSTFVILWVTGALLKSRQQVLKAIDEIVTRLVDRFLETDLANRPAVPGGSMLPALAQGFGGAAGMALGSKMPSKLGRGPVPTGQPTGNGKTPPTNVGGLNGDQKQLPGKQQLALEGGPPGQKAIEGPGSADSGGARALPAGSSAGGMPRGQRDPDGPDGSGGPLQLASGKAGSAQADKATAQRLAQQGGLTDLGYVADGGKGRRTRHGGTPVGASDRRQSAAAAREPSARPRFTAKRPPASEGTSPAASLSAPPRTGRTIIKPVAGPLRQDPAEAAGRDRARKALLAPRTRRAEKKEL